MKDHIEEYQKYKWFYTASGILVVGGKSAEQNDELLTRVKGMNKEYMVMHTSDPGSPFSILLADLKKVKAADKKESAVFTASFSRAWRTGKKTAKVDIFKLSQVKKNSKMKVGTWGVAGEVEHMEVPLKLVLTTQKGILRAVPALTVKNKKDILMQICPGKIDKQTMVPKFQIELDEKFSQVEILSALPAGGVAICR